jgi:hypothetical protein
MIDQLPPLRLGKGDPLVEGPKMRAKQAVMTTLNELLPHDDWPENHQPFLSHFTAAALTPLELSLMAREYRLLNKATHNLSKDQQVITTILTPHVMRNLMESFGDEESRKIATRSIGDSLSEASDDDLIKRALARVAQPQLSDEEAKHIPEHKRSMTSYCRDHYEAHRELGEPSYDEVVVKLENYLLKTAQYAATQELHEQGHVVHSKPNPGEPRGRG